MWKTPVKHRICALSFKMDNGATHTVAGMIGVFEVFDRGMAGQDLVDLLFEFAFAQAVDDPDLDLAFHDGIVEG